MKISIDGTYIFDSSSRIGFFTDEEIKINSDFKTKLDTKLQDIISMIEQDEYYNGCFNRFIKTGNELQDDFLSSIQTTPINSNPIEESWQTKYNIIKSMRKFSDIYENLLVKYIKSYSEILDIFGLKYISGMTTKENIDSFLLKIDKLCTLNSQLIINSCSKNIDFLAIKPALYMDSNIYTSLYNYKQNNINTKAVEELSIRFSVLWIWYYIFNRIKNNTSDKTNLYILNHFRTYLAPFLVLSLSIYDDNYESLKIQFKTVYDNYFVTSIENDDIAIKYQLDSSTIEFDDFFNNIYKIINNMRLYCRQTLNSDCKHCILDFDWMIEEYYSMYDINYNSKLIIVDNAEMKEFEDDMNLVYKQPDELKHLQNDIYSIPIQNSIPDTQTEQIKSEEKNLSYEEQIYMKILKQLTDNDIEKINNVSSVNEYISKLGDIENDKDSLLIYKILISINSLRKMNKLITYEDVSNEMQLLIINDISVLQKMLYI